MARYGAANICIVCSIRVGAGRDGCVVERGYVQFVSFTKAVISGILKWYGVKKTPRRIFSAPIRCEMNSPVVSSLRPFVARSCAQDHKTAGFQSVIKKRKDGWNRHIRNRVDAIQESMVIDTTVHFWLRVHDMVLSTEPLVRLAFSAVVSLVPMSHTHAKRCKRLRDTVGSCLALTCYNYETGEWREERAKCHLEGHLLRRVGIADERRGRRAGWRAATRKATRYQVPKYARVP